MGMSTINSFNSNSKLIFVLFYPRSQLFWPIAILLFLVLKVSEGKLKKKKRKESYLLYWYNISKLSVSKEGSELQLSDS